MSVLNATTSVVPQQQQPSRETLNGDSSRPYPPPTANYEDFANSPYLFWEKLKAFHDSYGTKLNVPTVGGKALDLHQLFLEVTSRGGFEQVIRDRKWKEVTIIFSFPPTITSASFILRKSYLASLYHFEQVYHFNKDAPPVSLPGGSLHGCSVTGTIDGKFDNGYLITVKMGVDQLKGVLYHMPNEQGSCYNSFDTPPLGQMTDPKKSPCHNSRSLPFLL